MNTTATKSEKSLKTRISTLQNRKERLLEANSNNHYSVYDHPKCKRYHNAVRQTNAELCDVENQYRKLDIHVWKIDFLKSLGGLNGSQILTYISQK